MAKKQRYRADSKPRRKTASLARKRKPGGKGHPQRPKPGLNPGAPPRANFPTGAPPPQKPALVNAFATADDMAAVNDWLTNFTTQLEDLDYANTQLTLDTGYQKQQNNQAAVENRSAADEAMAARGVFSSSLRDAAVLDIEATRALNNTYLDNKLNAAVTAGAARKGTLATAKTKFDAAMAAKYAENAKNVNDQSMDAYASAIANYKPPTPPTHVAPGPEPGARPPRPQRPHRPHRPRRPNQHQGSGSTRARQSYRPQRPRTARPSLTAAG
jgi:hypothetical protein